MNTSVTSEEQVGKASKGGRDNPGLGTVSHVWRDYSAIYGSWIAALPNACDCLLNLNHYAKDATCSRGQLQLIKDLKKRIIGLLYGRRLCFDCFCHKARGSGICFRCDGSGIFTPHRTRCRRCEGSGIYGGPSASATLVCFRFAVGEKLYGWHLPECLVSFEYRPFVTPPDSPMLPWAKPMPVNSEEIGFATDLLAWIVQDATRSPQLFTAAGIPAAEAVGAAKRVGGMSNA